MKNCKYILILLIFSLISCKTTRSNQYFPSHKFVYAFYDKKSKEPIIIYDKYNGKVIDTIEVLKKEPAQCYYKFAFSKSKNGWFKIETMRMIPCESDGFNNNVYKYHNNWANSKNLIITTSQCYDEDCVKFNFHVLPKKASKILYTTTNYSVTNLIEVNGNWAKVMYQKGDEEIIGWLPRNRQCTSPWTNCIFH